MQIKENRYSLHVMIVKIELYDVAYEIQHNGVEVGIEVGR